MAEASTVLVLGAGGFVGRALCMTLAASGRQVIAAGGRQPPAGDRVLHVPGRVDPDTGLAPLLEKADVVVHAATASTPGSTAGAPSRELESNLALTARLLEQMHERPRDLLYLSSGGSLYAGGDGPSGESARIRPRSYHGAAKRAAECFIGAWSAQAGGRATILRPSNVYGPGQSGRAGFAVIPTAFDRLLHDAPLSIWGDGSARRDYVYIDDLVRLCELVLASPMRDGTTIVNACSGVSTSLNDLLDTIESATGRTLRRAYTPARSVDAQAIDMDPSLAAALYGWRCGTSLPEGIELTWRWHQAMYSGAAR